MSYLIVYDIKELDNTTRLRVNRRLRKLKATRLQQSVWEFNNLEELRALVALITSAGGEAFVLEKRVANDIAASSKVK